MMKTKMIAAVMILAAFSTTMTAQVTIDNSQNEQKQRFTLEDLIPGGGTYYQSSYPETRYLTWWGDELVERALYECSLIDKQTGSKTTLFHINDVNQALRKASLTETRHLYLVEFPDAQQPLVLVELPSHRVLVDWKKHEVVWQQSSFQGDKKPTAEDWNSTSRHLAFVCDHNLYVRTADGQTLAVSKDGSLDIPYGESVHRDEFGIEKGTFWSPDGQRLAFYRMDQSMVTTYPQVDIAPDTTGGKSRVAQMEPDKYPMAGETSHKVSVGIFDVAAQKTIYLQTGDPTDRYFTNIAWAPDNQTLFLIELNRDQNYAHLDAYDVRTGQRIATLFEERNDKYVEPLHPIEFLPWDNSLFVYQTRNRDGYNHLFLYEWKNEKARLVRQLTQGQFEVINLLGFNRQQHTIVYTSNEADPIGCTVYAVDMKGKRQLLGDKNGWHTPQLSVSGTYVTDNWSWGGDSEHGRLVDVYATASPKPVRLLTADEPWSRFDVPEMKVGTLKAADGVTDLYYRLVLPTDFDPSKQYPAVIYVYGGPHAHNVDASRHWGVRGWDVWMAQQGYVMFCLDNRGSEHRGLVFEQATFRHLGDEEMKDQMAGVDYLRSLPYVDATRIGVHGWSFGGFMTTNLMTTYPDVFKVGVAGGPVIDWRYYEVMYGERYMDTPQTNPDGYNGSSLLNKAANLKGRLLLIYGGNDPTCVPQHTLSFIRASIDAGTHPDLFTYPGDGHNMQGTDRVHLHEHITRYFNDFLK